MPVGIESGTESESRAGRIAPQAWHELLAFLAEGQNDGAAAYEELHRRLQFFFEWKGCVGAAELSDETLNRVAAKLAAGEEIRTDARRYAFGVARFVYLEALKRNARLAQAEHSVAAQDDAEEEAAQREARFAALELCLDSLPPRTQQLVLRYHADDGQQRIDHRKQLADELGIALNALRIRIHRLRAQIEGCVRARLDRNDRDRAARRMSP